MIEALMTGKLYGRPEQRTSPSTGRSYVQARLRVAVGADETHFVRVTAFSETAGAALMALGDGDAVAVAGTLRLGAWTDRDGRPRPNADLVAAQVLTAYHLKRRRSAVQQSEGDATTGGDL
jgi:single-stranded DNA-binding protein